MVAIPSRRVASVVLRLAIGAALLAALVFGANPSRLLAQLQGLKPAWLAVAACLYAASLLLRGLRVWVLVKPMAPHADWMNVAASSTLGWSLNNVLPFRLGDIVRLYLVSQQTGAALAVVLLAFVAERVLDAGLLLVVVLIGVSFLGLPGLAPGQTFGLAIFGLVVLGVLLGIIGLRWLSGYAAGGSGQPSGLLGRVATRVSSVSKMLQEAFLTYFRPGIGSLALALTAGAWILQGLQYATFFHAMGADAPPLLFAAGFSAFMLTFSANFVPGQVGTFEALFVAVFAAMGIADVSSLLANALFLSLLGFLSYLKLDLTWGTLRSYVRPTVAR